MRAHGTSVADLLTGRGYCCARVRQSRRYVYRRVGQISGEISAPKAVFPLFARKRMRSVFRCGYTQLEFRRELKGFVVSLIMVLFWLLTGKSGGLVEATAVVNITHLKQKNNYDNDYFHYRIHI